MVKKKKYLLYISIALIIGVILIIFNEIYPVAFVGLKPVFAKDFNRNYSASMVYYEKALKTYAKDSQTLEANEIKKEIQRAVLDNLIENILIERELKKELKPSDLNSLVEKKMGEIPGSQTTDKAVETLYGFSFDEFKKRVLEPQAKKEILSNRLFLASVDFDERMKSVRSQANIMIFLPGLEWDGKEIILRD
ncbi:MAG: SurA N-terminal domain-containing protein [Patescibacteria group bacterium]|nr:SurA N-terminal domain-containing protein [Patescibacteria group bacterium]